MLRNSYRKIPNNHTFPTKMDILFQLRLEVTENCGILLPLQIQLTLGSGTGSAVLGYVDAVMRRAKGKRKRKWLFNGGEVQLQAVHTGGENCSRIYGDIDCNRCDSGCAVRRRKRYLGLRVGMTVSASIPAAVISMGIIRVILHRNRFWK